MTQITKEELRKLYNENSNQKAADALGVTKVTLLRYVDKAGIPRKGKGNGVGDSGPKLEIVEG